MAAAASARVAPLLQAALPHIREHGFTLAAVQAGQGLTPISTGQHQKARKHKTAEDEEAQRLGFGSTQAASLALLSTFDRTSLGVHFGEDRSADVREAKPSSEDEAWRRALHRIDGKIRQSDNIQGHLVNALALLSTGSFDESGNLFQNPPLMIMGRPLPSPRPITDRAFEVASTALYASRWKGQLNSDWYTTRARLSLVFLLAEFRLLAPMNEDKASKKRTRKDLNGSILDTPEAGGAPYVDNLTAALNVLQKVAGTSSSQFDQAGLLDRQMPHTASFPPASKWAHWGASGWLGIFRSLGL